MTNSTISNNTSTNGGGGILNNATMTVAGSTITGNGANTDGGGIYNSSTGNLVVTNGTTINGNTAVGDGGGIFNSGTSGTANVANSTFSSNTAYNGAGISNAGSLTVSSSAISGNTASGTYASGGGIYDLIGTATVTNSTISNDAAERGGGLYNEATLTLTNSTINSAIDYGGGIDIPSGTANLGNTILAGNQIGSGGSGPDCYGTLGDGSVGHNLLGNELYCGGLTNNINGDIVNADPRLGPLQNNGGPTQTMALGSTSPAIEAGNGTTCAQSPVNGVDQRGTSRHADSRLACDIGAYDTGGGISIAKGWNLIGVPVQSSTTGTASGLVSSVNGQLGSGAVSALATYAHGTFHLYVPGYSADQTLQPSEGIFVLSSKLGQWTPTGTAYAGGQMVSLQPGWNLVAAPFPYPGLNGDAINTQIGGVAPYGCGLQEDAIYVAGSYQTYTQNSGPHGTAFHVPTTLGMFVECTAAYTWTPS